MKQIVFILLGLMISSLTFGQTIKLQTGVSLSQLDWKYTGVSIDPVYNETFIGYSVLAGIDYMETKYFNLSSNLGVVREGGKGEIQLVDQSGEITGQTITKKPTLDYLLLNTTIEIKYPIKERISPFISVGPQFEYLLSNSEEFDGLKKTNELHSTSIGLLLGGGVTYDLQRIQLGLSADYHLNFTKVADWTNEQTGIGGEIALKTFTTHLTIGYKLK